MIIGIDHGYYAIKTRHFKFPAGVAVYSHVLANLPGDRAWRYDRSNYPSQNGRHREER